MDAARKTVAKVCADFGGNYESLIYNVLVNDCSYGSEYYDEVVKKIGVNSEVCFSYIVNAMTNNDFTSGSVILRGFWLILKLMRYGLLIAPFELLRIDTYLGRMKLENMTPFESDSFVYFSRQLSELLGCFQKVVQWEILDNTWWVGDSDSNSEIFGRVLGQLETFRDVFLVVHKLLDTDCYIAQAKPRVIRIAEETYSAVVSCYDQLRVGMRWTEDVFCIMESDVGERFLKVYEMKSQFHSWLELFRIWCINHGVDHNKLPHKEYFYLNPQDFIMKHHTSIIRGISPPLDTREVYNVHRSLAEKSLRVVHVAGAGLVNCKPWQDEASKLSFRGMVI